MLKTAENYIYSFDLWFLGKTGPGRCFLHCSRFAEVCLPLENICGNGENQKRKSGEMLSVQEVVSIKWNKKYKYCRIKTVSIYRKSSIWYMYLIFILQIKDIVCNAFELSMVLILFFLERTCWLSFSISGLTRMKNTGTSGWIGEWYVQGNSSNERKKGGGGGLMLIQNHF